MLKPSRQDSFVDAWTDSLVGIRANHLVQQDNERESKTPDTSGPGSLQQLELFDLDGASLKTSKDTLPKGCVTSCQTWASWVTEQRGEYSQRLKSVSHTNAKECLSWPTPTAMECADQGTNWSALARLDKGGRILRRIASYHEKGWPTPTTAEAGKISNCPNYGQLGLSNHPKVHGKTVQRKKLTKSRKHQQDQNSSNTGGSHRGSSQEKNWSTPQARDWKGAEGRAYKGQTKDLPAQTEATGKLNPRWVETLMGLPVGWTMPSCAEPWIIAPTNSDSSETEYAPQPLRKHGENYGKE
tara:strand:- start:747 stop:1640 length:894 start_codon:yes stop_codon:yes gene_type:complete